MSTQISEECYDWSSILGLGESDEDSVEITITQRPFKTEKHKPIDLEVHMKVESETKSHNICPKCQTNTQVSEGVVCCPKCGYTKIVMNHAPMHYSASLDKDHNTAKDSFMSFKIVGKGCYGYQRSLLKTCSNYKAFSKNTNKKDLHNFVFQYEGKKIPKNVIDLAIELFSKIKDAGYVFRGNGKRGVMGACLFYACVMKGITKTPREIASIMKIEERFLSSGDRVLQELNELDIIEIPTNFDPLVHYIHQYFPALGIHSKYEQFIVDIIQRAERKNIHIRNDSRMTTKCVGAIYLLTTRVKELNHITKEDIVKECSKISKSTFTRYYSLLCDNHKKIKRVFKRHGIKMPLEWKEGYEPKKKTKSKKPKKKRKRSK